MPVKEMVTTVLPTPRSSPIEIPASSGQRSSEVPATVIRTVRKIPISIHHMGKVKDFAIAETKTVIELYNEIRNLSKCSAPFVVSSFSSNVDLSAMLKSLSIDTSKLEPCKVTMTCSDPVCQQNFNSETLLKSVSTEELLAGAKTKIGEQSKTIEQQRDQIKKLLKKLEVEKSKNRALKEQLRTNERKTEKVLNKELTKDEKFNILKEYLSPIFSETMIKCFFKKGEWKTIRNFSEEDMCLALTIRGFSKKGYSYVPKEGPYTFTFFRKFFSDFLTKMSIYKKFMSAMALAQK